MSDALEKEPREPATEDRTTKKARFRESEPQANDQVPMSFRDKVMQSDIERENSLAGRFEDFEVTENDVLVYDNESMPSISFSPRIQEELSKQWKATVIVKLLGRPVGYRNLCNRLESMWNFTQGFDVIDLENDYFIVKLKSGSDVEAVLTGGPWIMLGHYLSVQAWYPQFDCSKDCIQKIQAWIRLPGMPIQYYNKKVLRYIGEMVGRVIKIDYCTEAAERGKFARIAVELDLSKPLVSQFCLDKRIQFVEYECLPRICFSCGRFGHVKEHCPDNVLCQKQNQGVAEVGEPASSNSTAANVNQNVNPNFGPWMLVGKKGKSKVMYGKKIGFQTSNSGKGDNSRGSRFKVLESDNMEDIVDLTEDRILEEKMIDSNTNSQTCFLNKNASMSHATKDKNAPAENNKPRNERDQMKGPLTQTRQPNTRFAVNKEQTTLDTMKHSVVTVNYIPVRHLPKSSSTSSSMEISANDAQEMTEIEPQPPDLENHIGDEQTTLNDIQHDMIVAFDYDTHMKDDITKPSSAKCPGDGDTDMDGVIPPPV
ncbi:uncharacterized protein LOC126676119 [Mercurialis annua]|uniref:uncharacterized protein LOC126676119 n=1 Tax=Mercurialis annua TaxID=3986 RepID=UPI002160EDF2|nr:uncharacterized protein LOC126676119 [Mercurialis annua]